MTTRRRTVFHCAACGARLSAPVLRVPLPNHGITPDHFEIPLGMAPGTYAVDDTRYGPPGTFVLAPGDVHNTRVMIEKIRDEPPEYGCLGIGAGPNLACASCGAEVGTRVDDCQAWQETRLAPAAVRTRETEVREADDPYPWDPMADEILGSAPWKPDGRWDWVWFGRLAAGTADVLARSGGGPLLLAEEAAEPVRQLLDVVLRGTGHASAVHRLPSPRGRTAAEWRLTASTAGLTPAALAGTPRRPVAICDLVGPDRSFTAATGELGRWCAEEGVRLGEVRVLGLVPLARIDPEPWPWRDRRVAWTPAASSGLTVTAVPLDKRVWDWLARGRPVEYVHAYGRWHGRRGIARSLMRRPRADEPWLSALIDELGRR
ncbi:hypothetical protein [Actinomadura miaoliensis]|uniref:Uncharacterized protein n=1 Tax=Actinomadura miaoliensis TaxID=430685 RepID=A0ABP7VI54_9ACTN